MFNRILKHCIQKSKSNALISLYLWIIYHIQKQKNPHKNSCHKSSKPYLSILEKLNDAITNKDVLLYGGMRDGLQQRRYPFHQAVVTALSAYLPKDLLVFSMPRSPCYGKILCDDDPISAFCLVFMIGHKFFCRRSVFITVIRNHCGDHHTVFKLRLVDRDCVVNPKFWTKLNRD